MKKSVQKFGMEQLRSCHGQGTSAEELQDSQISEVVIKKAQAGDLPRILEIYAYAREFMKRTGNPNQWKENAPQKEVLEADIRAGQLYVVRQKNRMTGVFALVIGKDPTYAQIEQGAWISESEYGTLHRVAGDGTVHGLFRRIVLFSEEKIGHLRIDTHADNHIMQHLILKNGFEQCGIIHIADGSERIAYEKVVSVAS